MKLPKKRCANCDATTGNVQTYWSSRNLMKTPMKTNYCKSCAKNIVPKHDHINDHFEATLMMSVEGKSQAEREMKAMASKEWLEFHKALARLEAIYEFQKLKFSVLEKEYFAQHQQLSLDQGLIKKEQE
jgi:hypothetical protein